MGNGILGIYTEDKPKDRCESIGLLSVWSTKKEKSMEKKAFGTAGEPVFTYSFENKNGMKMTVCEFGASLIALEVPDRDRVLRDVVLGYEELKGYLSNPSFFGVTVGRNANRMAGACFSIGENSYQLEKNEGENNLHSGPNGYEKMLWQVKEIDEENLSITFFRRSPDGEQGFPGNFDICVTYRLTQENAVEIHYEGVADADTAVNMTNHSYFNLGGHDSGSILAHRLLLKAKAYTPIRPDSVPTGEILEVAGTPMDFNSEKEIGLEIDTDFAQTRLAGGYDHNFVLSGDYEAFASVFCPQSGIGMEVSTDCPGVQFYTGNFITPCEGKKGAHYGKRDGFCLETQNFPNAVNQPNFPNAILKRGERYDQKTAYRFFIK